MITMARVMDGEPGRLSRIFQQVPDVEVGPGEPVAPLVVLPTVLVDLGHVPLGDRILVQQTPDVEQLVKIYFGLGSMSSFIKL